MTEDGTGQVIAQRLP